MAHEENLEALACDICGKPVSIHLDRCHQSWGQSNPLCSEHQTCRIQEKSEEQIDYVCSSITENVFLKACPGSGKTEVVGMKAARTIENWRGLPGGIAVLTFTKNAATEISQRVNQLAGVERMEYPHFIGTFDSWLHGYVANPFGHTVSGYKGQSGDHSIRIVDEHDNSPWLSAYALATQYWYFASTPRGDKALHSIPLYANKIRFEHESKRWEIKNPTAEIADYIADEDYYYSRAFMDFRRDKPGLTLDLMRSGFKQKKALFSSAGFATYQDIENFCYEILRDDATVCDLVARRFPLIMVDECQDLSWVQLQVLDKLRLHGTILHFIGDLNQGIYEFRKVNPQIVDKFTRDKEFAILPLSANYRSCQPIVDLCNRIVADDAPEKSERTQLVDNPCICVRYAQSEMHLLPFWFGKYLEQGPCEKGKSAIVARNWNNVSRLRPSGNTSVRIPQERLAAAIQLWKSGCEQSLDDSLNHMGHFIADKYFSQYSYDTRYHYCPECVDSHLRWRLFLSGILQACVADGSRVSNLNQTWSNWAAIVRSELSKIVRGCLPLIGDNITGTIPPFDDLIGSKFATPQKKGELVVLATLPTFSEGNEITALRTTTIHSVKGKEFDALLLVSAPDKKTKDGHWERWLEDPASEAARLAYVASSRPRHLLAWAIPDTATQKNLDKIRKLGFHLVQMEAPPA